MFASTDPGETIIEPLGAPLVSGELEQSCGG
jgi:hypothetical protein